MKERRLFFLIVLVGAWIGCLFGNTPPVVSNVQASQRTDGSKIVDIYYNIADTDGDTLSVSVQVSNDNGASFAINPSLANLSGAIGDGILSGVNKHIVWNAGEEGIIFDGNQFSVKVVAEDINLTEGLVAYYPFNGNANDESNYSNNGQVYQATLIPDRFGENAKAYYFDGVNDRITIPSTFPFHQSGYASVTFSFWLKKEDSQIRSVFWTRNDDNDINRYHMFTGHSGQGFTIDYRSQSGTLYLDPYQSELHISINPASWTHVVVVKSGNEYNLFKNGQYVRTINDPYPDLPTYAGSWRMGYNHPINQAYKGAIDDIRLYNRTLSQDEILALYHEGGWPNLNHGLVAYYPFNGNASDESGNGLHGTLINSPGFASDRFGYQNRSVCFQEGPSYVSIPYYNYSLNPISISCWLKSTALPTFDWVAAISIFDEITAADYRILQTGSTIAVAQHHPLITWCVTQHYTISLNEWYHIVLRYENHNLQFFVNGDLIDSITCSDPVNIGVGPTDYCIGKEFGLQESHINADIDDVRFYNRAISPDEVTALYHEGGWPLTKQNNPNTGEE